jgi:16S rRNA (uracil1498-N3)-methyltransferase
MRYFLCNTVNLESKSILIDSPDAHHIRHVLRLPIGATIRLLDGRNRVYEATIERYAKAGVQLSILASYASDTESPVQIHIGQGYLKDKKTDAVIRQLNELGIHTWFPIFSRYSIPRPDPKRMSARQARWLRIVEESIKQCHRGRLMQIGPALNFKQVLESAADFEKKIIFHEQSSHRLVPAGKPIPSAETRILALSGPEGGFSEAEINLAVESGFEVISLGPRILRAETAAVTAAAVLQFVFGDLGKK